MLYATLDAVVDGYAPVVAGLQTTSTRSRPRSSGATPPCRGASTSCAARSSSSSGPCNRCTGILALGRLREVRHRRGAAALPARRRGPPHPGREQVEGFRHLLRDILTVNATLVAQKQNEEMKTLTEASMDQNEEVKKISAWAAILFAPTLIGTVYGMNFDVMPELHWQLGYPMAIGLMVLVSVTLFGIFKRRAGSDEGPRPPPPTARRLAAGPCSGAEGPDGITDKTAGTTSRASSGCRAVPWCAGAGSGGRPAGRTSRSSWPTGRCRRGRTGGSRGRDFRVPADTGDALDALHEARRRATPGNGSRSPAAGASVGRGRRWPRSPSSTACRPATRSTGCGSVPEGGRDAVAAVVAARRALTAAVDTLGSWS